MAAIRFSFWTDSFIMNAKTPTRPARAGTYYMMAIIPIKLVAGSATPEEDVYRRAYDGRIAAATIPDLAL